MPTYHAICPDCGATILLNMPGDLYAGCPDCSFYGWVPSITTAAETRPLAPTQAQASVTPPLSDEQMGAIRAILSVTDRGDTRFHATQALLAEVERLRAENKEIAHEKALALSEPHTWDWMEFSQENECVRQELAQAQAREAQMREIVSAVAEHIGGYGDDRFRQCVFCGNGAAGNRIIYHLNDCPVIQARALLEATGSEATNGK